jgi:hypothetical protein
MKKNLLTASVFVFGLILGGASASASNLGPSSPGPLNITEEMARCIRYCQAAGDSHDACWACCVHKVCPIDVQ